MDASTVVGLIVVIGVVGFAVADFTKARDMSLSEILAFAVKAKQGVGKIEAEIESNKARLVLARAGMTSSKRVG